MKTFRHFLIYKPFGVLSQFSDPVGGKRTLGELYDFPKDVYPVGRLDEDSEGLLLLSNDPKANSFLLGGEVEKEYWVQVEGTPTEEMIAPLRSGVDIRVRKKTYRTKPAKVEILNGEVDLPDRIPPIRYRKTVPDAWLSIVISEGKNRQVRKMTARIGLPTLRLVRVRMGNCRIEKLQPGDVVELKDLSKVVG